MSKDKITVIQSFPNWLPTTQTWMYNQVYYLPKEIDNHIVCDRTQNLDQFNLPNIHSLLDKSLWQFLWEKGRRKLKLIKHSPYLLKQAQKYQIQILHSHFGHIAWFDLPNTDRIKLKHVVTFYGYDVNSIPKNDPIWVKRYQQLFEKADRILCEGSHMAKCIENLGCPPEKIKVHHLGVKLNKIKYQPRVWNRRETLKVLIAASFVEKKGIPYAIEALGRLQHEIPLEITIIGDASKSQPKSRQLKSKSEKEKILAAIDKHNLGSKVNLLGYQPYEVFFEQAYKHHLFISPSITAKDGDTEGGAPVSITEMAATGMPIVSTTHCDIPEVIKHGITGLLAPEKDIEGLAKNIQWFVNNPDKWQEMLDAGRKHIEREYDSIEQGKKLAKIYRDLAQS